MFQCFLCLSVVVDKLVVIIKLTVVGAAFLFAFLVACIYVVVVSDEVVESFFGSVLVQVKSLQVM